MNGKMISSKKTNQPDEEAGHMAASLYPQVIETNPEIGSPFLCAPPNQSSSSSLYPSIDTSNVSLSSSSSYVHPTIQPAQAKSSMYPSVDVSDLAENLFPDTREHHQPVPNPTAPEEAREERILTVHGAIAHLIDKQCSVELASGDLSIVRLVQSGNVVAMFVRIDDEVQWPLAKDEPVVKLDDSHYFFTLHVPAEAGGSPVAGEDTLSYGLTFTDEGQKKAMKELDGILEQYGFFSVQSVNKVPGAELLLHPVAEKKKEMDEAAASAYWTTLAPNVEDYSGSVARGIASGSGQLIRGIFWCGEVTIDRLRWGDEFLKKKLDRNCTPTEIDEHTLKRIRRAKALTNMSERVMTGVLSGVLKVSGFFTSSVVNSKAGQKFFSLLPGEIALASLDGFGKVCDALEVVGKNVLSTSSTVTTSVVSHRYGDEAGEATKESLDAAGHAFGTAWAVFKIRKALNPKNVMKSSTMAKAAVHAAAEAEKAKKGK